MSVDSVFEKVVFAPAAWVLSLLEKIVEGCFPRPVEVPEGATPEEVIHAMQIGSAVRKLIQLAAAGLMFWGLLRFGKVDARLTVALALGPSLAGIILGIYVGVRTMEAVLSVAAMLRRVTHYPPRAGWQIMSFALTAIGMNSLLMGFVLLCPGEWKIPAAIVAGVTSLVAIGVSGFVTVRRICALASA